MAGARHRRRSRQRREGAVMLVVMLILLVATATAAVSVQATQYELRAAGYQRESQQARYISEAALMSTLAWVDALGTNFLDTWKAWEGQPPPDMTLFGEPDFDPGDPTYYHHASRVMPDSLTPAQLPGDVDPYGDPQGLAAVPPSPPDPTGSLGPRSGLRVQGYVVDITDCQQSTTGHTPGAAIGGGSGSAVKNVTFYCIMTSRARLCPADWTSGGCTSVTRDWQIGSESYLQDRFGVAHDSRATFITPEMIVPVE